MPSKARITSADFSPVAPLVRNDRGTSIVPPGGISLPSMSTTVQVQLAALRTHRATLSDVLRSTALNWTVVLGDTKPASSRAWSALTGHRAICAATWRARSAICCTCARAKPQGAAESRAAITRLVGILIGVPRGPS